MSAQSRKPAWPLRIQLAQPPPALLRNRRAGHSRESLDPVTKAAKEVAHAAGAYREETQECEAIRQFLPAPPSGAIFEGGPNMIARVEIIGTAQVPGFQRHGVPNGNARAVKHAAASVDQAKTQISTFATDPQRLEVAADAEE